MTNWRALCEELVEALEIQLDELRFDNRLCNRARAALAQPEPEVVGPSVEELDDLFNEIDQSGEPLSWRAYARAVWDRARAALAAESVAAPAEPTDEAAVEAAAELIYMEAMEWAARQSIPSGHINIPAWQQGGNSDAQEVARRTARAVMSRFGHQPAPPADGEVAELVAALLQVSDGASARGDEGSSWITARAADLLERQAVPVAVSERPWEREGWCDSEGRCWIHCPGQSWDTWVLTVPQNAIDGAHCLPATALPLPSGEVK